jgi:hypothetical protein
MERLPKSVYNLVVATVADYDRMKILIEKNQISREQTATFVRKISAIDNALVAVCDGERSDVRDALRLDIAQKRGYERGFARSYYTSEPTYVRRKQDAILLIAKMLELI